MRASFQDAHEFLIFLINHINEIIVGELSGGAGPGVGLSKAKTPDTDAENSITWINEIFQVTNDYSDLCDIIITSSQGILTSETRCLNCETVTSKDEEFCDLSIDVDQVSVV